MIPITPTLTRTFRFAPHTNNENDFPAAQTIIAMHKLSTTQCE